MLSPNMSDASGRWTAATAALLLAGCAGSAHAQSTAHTLIGLDLRTEPIALVGIDRHAVHYVDAARQRQQRPLADILAIAPASWSLPDGSTPDHGAEPRGIPVGRGALETIGGAWIFGDTATTAEIEAASGADTAEMTLAWRSMRLGLLFVPLDAVRTVWPARGTDPSATRSPVDEAVFDTGGADVVLLENGERLTGFVDSIEPAAVNIEDERLGTTVAAMERVRAIRLGAQPTPAPGAIAWLADGSVLAGLAIANGDDTSPTARRGPSLDAELVLGEGSRTEVHIGLGEVEAVAFDAGSFVALSSLPIEAEQAVGVRLLEPTRIDRPDAITPPPPLNVSGVLLPGPMEVAWSLPDRAERVAFEAVLPEDDRLWGDCNVRVLLLDDSGTATVELASFRLNSVTPTHPVNAELPRVGRSGSRELVVRVEPGARGPVHDRVELRLGLIKLAR